MSSLGPKKKKKEGRRTLENVRERVEWRGLFFFVAEVLELNVRAE